MTRDDEGPLTGFRGGMRDLLTPAATAGNGRPRAGAVLDDGALSMDDLPIGAVGRGPEETRKLRISGQRRWYAGSMVGLIYLAIAMGQAATSGGSPGTIIVFEALAVCFAAVYILAPVRVASGGAFAGADGGTAGKFGLLAVMLVITVPMIALGGTGVTGLWIYIGVVAAMMFRLPVALAVAVLLAAAMLIVSAVAGDGLPWELAVTLIALTLWMVGFAGNIRLTVELRATREELARAAVVAERARIGRDLHDILGHSLTAIAVKAGLARRLAEHDAPPGSAGVNGGRIIAEISDVERLAREALADVRATAAGYRDVSLAAELAVARSVLEAAGIAADIPTAVDNVSPAGREVFGYVVREAVTNVVRHSGARHCVIELSPEVVEVHDDGRGAAGSPGAGLHGLSERLAAVGGSLVAGPRPGGGFAVRAALASDDVTAVP